MPVSIRVARHKDVDSVCALWLALMREHEQMDSRWKLASDAEERWYNDFKWLVDDEAHLFLVAVSERKIVGFVHAYLWEDLPIYAHMLEVFIASIYVLPGHRMKGAAAEMVNQVKEWAIEQQAGRMRLGILAANSIGANFWESQGGEALSIFYTLPLNVGSPSFPGPIKRKNP